MDITKFNEKLNRISGNVYTIEEEVIPVNGVYEATLIHDNVTTSTINVYTGSKLTGDKINTYSSSTPSLTPWKTIIKIFSNAPKLYISYESTGDQIEAEDVNKLQDAVVETQESLNNEINRATNAEKVLTDNLNAEILRAKSSENMLTNNLNSEVVRAKSAESVLTTNLDSEINRAKAKESSIDTELANRYTKDKVYTKDEVLQKISELINNAPNVLDTFKEIADALGNDPNFAATMTTMLAGKVDKVSGKGLSTNDYTDTEKANLVDTNNKKHEHGNKSVIDGITATLIGYWNAAYTHISDTIKHITSDERNLWNTVSNKVDKIAGKSLSTNDFDNNYKSKIDGISSNANKVEASTINGNIKIDSLEKTVYTHPSGTNPHGTTKTDIGLGNVTNDSQVKRSEMGIASGVATLDSAGNNNQPPKAHTHDDRYYTETEANTKFATIAQISQAGYGDMMKNVYDSNNDGVVDNADNLDGISSEYFSRPFTQGKNYQGTIGGSTDLGWKKLFRMAGYDRSGNGSNTSTNSYYDAGTIIGYIYDRNGNYYQGRTNAYDFQFTIHSWSGTSRVDSVTLYIPNNMPDIIRVVKYGVCDYEIQIRSDTSWKHIGFKFFEAGNGNLLTYAYQNLVSDGGGTTVVKSVNNKDRISHEPLTWNDLEGV
ncbi:hypothetical protein [Clostridium beijerinckii]|uniref:hypothetical protein n=1 Tax=Clostridium beijerinckii TaxID=1520 RepID=UPI00232A83A5|nr:hypothetical protein [Clostridium beijerinckii]